MVEKKRSRLDELAQQFELERQSQTLNTTTADDSARERARRKPFQSKRLKMWLILLLLIFVLTATFSAMKFINGAQSVDKNPDMEQYETVLTSTEKKEWKEKKNDRKQITLQVNTRIPVKAGGESAEIRLINPPYNLYSCSFILTLKETPNKILYSSEEILPGTVIETIDLNADPAKALTPGEHKAVVSYTFHDRNGKERGTYDVDVTLVVE